MFPTVLNPGFDSTSGWECSCEGKTASCRAETQPGHDGPALVLGIPLWRLQQRLSKQLQMEEAGKKQGVVIWVYVYRGAEIHSHGTPADLDKMVPDDKTRRASLVRDPRGFTGEVTQYGYWYGYGVRPVRVLGDDVGVVIFRMDPK